MSVSAWKDFHTLESFIAQEQVQHRESRGVFSNLLRRVGLATKIIAAKVQRAGLLEMLGDHGEINVQGEQQKKLDVIANDVLKATFKWMPSISGLASEEEDVFVELPPRPAGDDRYVVMFDPLDGSSNIDANVSVGTIFSVQRCVSRDGKTHAEDFLQPVRKQEAAGYVLYGPCTMLVYTTGHGVHMFILDPEIGEYVLARESVRIPDVCKCLSVNTVNYGKWDKATQRFVDHVQGGGEPRYQKTTNRYIGSLVSDFHRNLMYGGVFLYPAESKGGRGKLRLLYEAGPLAMLAEQAGGSATNGRVRIMDLTPRELHERVPLIIGNTREIELYERFVREQGSAPR